MKLVDCRGVNNRNYVGHLEVVLLNMLKKTCLNVKFTRLYFHQATFYFSSSSLSSFYINFTFNYLYNYLKIQVIVLTKKFRKLFSFKQMFV